MVQTPHWNIPISIRPTYGGSPHRKSNFGEMVVNQMPPVRAGKWLTLGHEARPWQRRTRTEVLPLPVCGDAPITLTTHPPNQITEVRLPETTSSYDAGGNIANGQKIRRSITTQIPNALPNSESMLCFGVPKRWAEPTLSRRPDSTWLFSVPH